MASVPYATAAKPATVSEGASSTIGKGKDRSLPVSPFTFEVPGSSRLISVLTTTPEQQTPQPPWNVIPQTDSSEMAGNTTPKLKPRRVSTSALPAIAGLPSNLAFRDEMGISQRTTSPTTSRPQAERSDSSGAGSAWRARPRKAMSMSSDTRDPTSSTDAPVDPAPKRARRNMWTEDETRHLVEGCKIHGVGNWKMILEDPRFKFQDRSPVDLKDRFRVSFPEAYRKHYPNAKTHLSHRTKSALPDGVPVFEKSLPKKRRPFTAQEDEALKRGYEKYGTVWASIAKDPIFATRRSTDLRDRFRNAFPDLYVKAGYKPRAAPKKIISEPVTPAKDELIDELATIPGRSTTPSPRRIRRKSDGTGRIQRSKSLRARIIKSTRSSEPSAPCSDAEDEDDGVVETSSPTDESLSRRASDHDTSISTQQAPSPPVPPTSAQSPSRDLFLRFSPVKRETSTPEHIPSFLDSSYTSEYSRPEYNASASGFAASARRPEDQIPVTSVSIPGSPPSTFGQRPIPTSPATRIGNSAWGPSSWLSSNPRLDSTGLGSRPTSFLGIGWPIPEHGVFDRYDLYSGSNNVGATGAHEYASEAGDSKHHPSDPSGATPGFTHHPYAGDLISAGAGLYSNQDLEYLSTTSGTTSHLDVGQLSLQSENEGEADPFTMDEQPFAFNEDAFASLSVERPHTAEPGFNRGAFVQGMAGMGSPLRRPSTAMSMLHTAQLDPSTSNYYHVPRAPSAVERGVSAPTTTPASPFMTASQSLNFEPASSPLNTQSHMQRSRSSTSFGQFPSPQSPVAPPPPSSFKRFADPAFTPFTQQTSSPQPFGFTPPSSTPTTFPTMVQSHHVRSASQPPREHRQYHIPSSSRPPPSIYDFLQLDDIASSSPIPSSAHVEPLSTAALDLHYGAHVGRLTPSYIRDNPNDPLVAHSAFMQGLELGLGLALQHTTSTAAGPQGGFGVGGNRPLIEALMASATVAAPTGSVDYSHNTPPPPGQSRMAGVMSHTRGQSFTVSPRELGLDNLDNGAGSLKKRKRASWDGRPT